MNETDGTPIIDFHIHVGLPEHYHPWVREFMAQSYPGEDFDALLRRMMTPQGVVAYLDQCDVDYAVALGGLNPVTTGMITNEFVAEFCATTDRLIPFCNVNPHLVTRPERELERCVRELGSRGLKLYPTYQHFYPNDRLLYRLYEKAETLAIPVMFHTGSSVFRGARLKYGDPLFLDDVAVDFPGIPLVQAHGGRGFWYDHAFFLAQLHPNVYLDISGLPPKNLLRYFPQLTKVADRVVFGSDWPGPSIKDNIEAVRALPIGAADVTAILGGNAARLLHLTARRRANASTGRLAETADRGLLRGEHRHSPPRRAR